MILGRGGWSVVQWAVGSLVRGVVLPCRKGNSKAQAQNGEVETTRAAAGLGYTRVRAMKKIRASSIFFPRVVRSRSNHQ